MRNQSHRKVGDQRRQEKGQALVEFALLFTFLALLLMGVLAFGIIFTQQLALQNIVRGAARAATVQDARLEYCDPNQGSGHHNDPVYDMTIASLGTLDLANLVSITIYDPNVPGREDVLDRDGVMSVQNFTNSQRCSLAATGGDIGVMVVYTQEIPVPVVSAITGDTVDLWARAVFPLQ